MRSVLFKFATPLIVGLFLISLISGIALFAHWGGNLFRGMHIWLSMVLIIPFVLHVWKNWRAMSLYFRQWSFAVVMVVSLAVAIGFIANANTGGRRQQAPPTIALTRLLMNASPDKLAPALGASPDKLMEKLHSAGFDAAEPGLSLREIAKRSGKEELAIVSILTSLNR
mgnify:FL=1